jgi:hypothetical protein
VHHIHACRSKVVQTDLTSPPAEHFDPLALQISKVSEALALVVQEQAYLRAREERHRISKRADHAFRPVNHQFKSSQIVIHYPVDLSSDNLRIHNQLSPELAAIVRLVA